MGAMTLSLLRLFAQRTPTSLEPITIISVRHEASLSKPKGSNVPVIYVLSVQPKHIRKQRALRRVRHTTGVQVLLKVGLLTTSDARSLLPLLRWLVLPVIRRVVVAHPSELEYVARNEMQT